MSRTRLKDVVRQQKSSLKLSDLKKHGAFPVFGASGLVGYRDCFQSEKEAVAIIKDGAGIGRVSMLPKHSSVLGTMQMLEPKEGISNSYLFYFLSHLKLGKSFTGSTIPHIYFKNYSDFSFPDVSYNQQCQVAEKLDAIRKSIEQKNNQLSDLDSLVKSRFIDMFKEWNLSFQKENWIKLSDLTNIYTGTTPKTEIEEYWNGLIPWVTPAELDKDSYLITDTERHITKKGQKSKSLTMMPIGTVLLSTRAPIGKVAICGVPMTCNQGFKNFECLEKLHPTYLFYLLKLNNDWLQTQGTGTTFKEISKSKAGNIRIPVPTMSDQKDFAQFYNLVDKSRFVVHSRYFLWLNFTFVSSTIAYSRVVSILECPKRC